MKPYIAAAFALQFLCCPALVSPAMAYCSYGQTWQECRAQNDPDSMLQERLNQIHQETQRRIDEINNYFDGREDQRVLDRYHY